MGAADAGWRGAIHIGISGWRYPPWRGVFYPKGLPQHRELEYASRQLSSIEINGSHYSLQRPECYEAWYRATPPGFVFSVKGSRYITHMLKLREIEQPLANFFASGVFRLREKLGPFLWQFPPQLAFAAERFEAFFALLPRDTEAALALARNHDARMQGRACLEIDAVRPLRHAVEIRHPSFCTPSFVELLARYDIALVVADTAGKWPYVEDVTSEFMYLRLHGDVELYASGYSEAALARWAARIDAWSRGGEPVDAHNIAARTPPLRTTRDVYCYFDNDRKVHAPFDARTLATMLDVGVPESATGASEERRGNASARSRPNAHGLERS